MTQEIRRIFLPKPGYDKPEVMASRFETAIGYDELRGLNLLSMSILEINVCKQRVILREIGNEHYRASVLGGYVSFDLPKETDGVSLLTKMYEEINLVLGS